MRAHSDRPKCLCLCTPNLNERTLAQKHGSAMMFCKTTSGLGSTAHCTVTHPHPHTSPNRLWTNEHTCTYVCMWSGWQACVCVASNRVNIIISGRFVGLVGWNDLQSGPRRTVVLITGAALAETIYHCLRRRRLAHTRVRAHTCARKCICIR